MKENIVVSFFLRNVGIKFLLVSRKSIHVGSGEMGGWGNQHCSTTGSEETYLGNIMATLFKLSQVAQECHLPGTWCSVWLTNHSRTHSTHLLLPNSTTPPVQVFGRH